MRAHRLLSGFIFLMFMTVNVICAEAQEGGAMSFTLRSPAFEEGQPIPKKYSGEGEDVSPPLQWQGAPEGAKSFTLMCDDPDAPMGTWVHWVLFNVPASVNELPEQILPVAVLPDGSCHGITNFGRLGYGGPYPPRGTHRYYFKLYALDTMLELSPGVKKKDVLAAMQGHVLAETQLMGTYTR